MTQLSLPDFPLEILIRDTCVDSTNTSTTLTWCHATQLLAQPSPGCTLLGWMPMWTAVPLAFLMLYRLNVDDIFLSVYLYYLTNLLAFVVSSNHLRENKENFLLFLTHGHNQGADKQEHRSWIHNFSGKSRLVLAVKNHQFLWYIPAL